MNNLLFKYYALKESSESTLKSIESDFKRLSNEGWEVNISQTSADNDLINSLINQSTEYSESISELSNSIKCTTKVYKSYIAISNSGEEFKVNGLYDKDSDDFKSLADLGVTSDNCKYIIEANYIESVTVEKTDLAPPNSISVQIYESNQDVD